MALPSQILQKYYILASGTAANASDLASFESLVPADGSFATVDALVDSYMGQLAGQQGALSLVQAIAKNGLGMILSEAQIQQAIPDLLALGVDSWSKLLNVCINLQDNYGLTLTNRADAANSFLDTLNTANKAADFTGAAVSGAVATLLQNIGSSATSLSNGTSALNALADNLTTSGITGAVVDGYVTGASVFADANGDGILNVGEWSATTDTNGNFETPNSTASGKIIAYGGTDMMTGIAYQGVLGATVGATVINPITTVIEAMVSSGTVATVADATAAMRTALGLPQDINLLSYNPLAVLASSTATSTEKATALSVEISALQIANIITQTSAVIAAATTGATTQSAGAAVAKAIAGSIATAAASTSTLSLSNWTNLNIIIQAAATATGNTSNASQIAQIALVSSASNTSVAAATTTTELAQAAGVAQGSATAALIAGATSGSYSSATSGFTGSALNTLIYNASVGSLATGVVVPPTAASLAESAVFDMTETGGIVTVAGNSTNSVAITLNGGAATRQGAAVTPSSGTLVGDTGVDSSAYAGPVALTLAAGDNTFVGGAGADTVFVGSLTVTSTISLGAGNNYVVPGDNSNISGATITATGGTLSISLDGAASVTMAAAQAAFIASAVGTQNVIVADQATNLALNADIETFTLGNFVNSVTQGAVGQTILGGSAADTVTAISGVTSTSELSAGANIVIVSNGADISGGTFNSTGGTVGYNVDAAATATMTASQASQISSAVGTQNITLSNLATGMSLNAAIETYTLAAGTNSATVGVAGQVINANALTDAQVLTLAGSLAATVTLVGGDLSSTSTGNTTVTATSGSNVITTSSGLDTITGGAGADTLTGGAGNDVFKYTAITDGSTVGATFTGYDTITDFWGASDKISVLGDAASVVLNGAGAAQTANTAFTSTATGAFDANGAVGGAFITGATAAALTSDANVAAAIGAIANETAGESAYFAVADTANTAYGLYHFVSVTADNAVTAGTELKLLGVVTVVSGVIAGGVTAGDFIFT